MKCPFCSHAESKVVDSRVSSGQDVIRRRRECETCVRRFTTYERVEEVLPMIVKKDGRRELFDRRKLMSGLRRATEKRPIAMETLEGLIDAIERELIDLAEKEVLSHLIGEKVMIALRKLDPIAYLRFASVYRSFQDLGEVQRELEALSVKGQ
jgi:transcriptional repressor NrdR